MNPSPSELPDDKQKLLQAFSDRFYAYVFAVAQRFADNRISRDEIVQEAYKNLLSRNSHFVMPENEGQLLAYLKQAIWHATLELRKKHNRYENRHSSYDGDDSQIADDSQDVRRSSDVGSAIEQQERSEIVKRLIEKLPDDQQDVIRLTFWEGLRLTEIAESMNLNRNVVETKLGHALTILKRELALKYKDGTEAI